MLKIAALSLCCLGAPHSAVKSMIQMLVTLQHHIHLAFGDLEMAQGQADWQELTVGNGQGNGARLHIWAVVTTPLFEIMRVEGLVALFICSLSKVQRAMAGLAFVDNTDLVVNADSNIAEGVGWKM